MTESSPTPTKLPPPNRRKPRKFSGQAKTIVSAAAVTALIGGWNLIAHLDNAQAEAIAPVQPAPQLDIAAAATEIHLNTPTPTPWPTLAPLVVDAIPTLVARSTLPVAANTIATRTGVIQLPEMAALAPLPELAPLPSMPSLPPPPSSGGGGSNGGGGGGSGGGAQTSGGS